MPNKSILLRRRVRLGENAPYPLGAVSFEITNVSGGAAEFVVETRRDTETVIDRAGDLREKAAANDDPAKEEWLDTARAQRVKLYATDNGRTMLTTYGKYSEAYSDAFQYNSVVRLWQKGGVCKAMAADTNAAVKAGGVRVNDKTYTDNETNAATTYNFKAFSMKLAVSTALANTSEYYDEAIQAAHDFSDRVNETGNSSDTTAPMTGEDVYNAVKTPPPQTCSGNSLAEYNAVTAYYEDRSIAGKNEPDKYGLQEFYNELTAEKAAKSNGRADVSGRGTVRIIDGELKFDTSGLTPETAAVLKDEVGSEGFLYDLIKAKLTGVPQ